MYLNNDDLVDLNCYANVDKGRIPVIQASHGIVLPPKLH